jgi:anti-anti-sigma factor
MGVLDGLSGGPKSAEEWWKKGRALVETEEYDQAIACFNKALDLDPRRTANYLERGNAHLLRGDADAAIVDFTQFIRLNQSLPVGADLPRRRRLDVEEFGDVTAVNFTDNKILDRQSVEAIGEEILSLVDELGRKKIVLDLAKVEYLSSGILGKFIALNKRLRAAGGRLALCNINPQIYEVFEVTRLK